MQRNLKDLAAGALFVAIGGFFTLNAWFNLTIGNALAMGPGYFPILLGLVLIGLGAAIALPGCAHGRTRSAASRGAASAS